MIRYVLTDIEGTTSALSFVKETLFPYAAAHMAAYLKAHGDEAEVQETLMEVEKTIREEGDAKPSPEETIQVLLDWIAEDRKHTALKKLQGMIWREGYRKGDFTGHVYPDVPARLAYWHNHGIGIGVYSSGSVEAQQLLFRYSDFGDLTPFFSDYFDTNIGHKREKRSYENISKRLGTEPEDILFLSDVPEELDAAADAGMQAIQLLRPGTEPSGRHKGTPDFTAIQL